MEIFGGRAGLNSVSFTSEKYKSLTRWKNKKLMTEISVNKGNRRITDFLSKIPFVRSFSMLLEIVINYWKVYVFGLVPLIIANFILIRESNSNTIFTLPFNTLQMVFGFLILAGIIIKITPVGKYHAAEHMAANAYAIDSELTLEKVKRQPRTHKGCGTNLVMSIFICYTILFLIFGDSTWALLVSWGIGYEIWKMEPKIIWNGLLIIGKVVQYLFFTTKPGEKHLVVAMEAVMRLEEKEGLRRK